MIRYEMIIYWSNEDHAYIVEVPELPGCMADGRTYQEAVSNAEVIIAEWIETVEELGRPIPNPQRKVDVRLTINRGWHNQAFQWVRHEVVDIYC